MRIPVEAEVWADGSLAEDAEVLSRDVIDRLFTLLGEVGHETATVDHVMQLLVPLPLPSIPQHHPPTTFSAHYALAMLACVRMCIDFVQCAVQDPVQQSGHGRHVRTPAVQRGRPAAHQCVQPRRYRTARVSCGGMGA